MDKDRIRQLKLEEYMYLSLISDVCGVEIKDKKTFIGFSKKSNLKVNPIYIASTEPTHTTILIKKINAFEQKVFNGSLLKELQAFNEESEFNFVKKMQAYVNSVRIIKSLIDDSNNIDMVVNHYIRNIEDLYTESLITKEEKTNMIDYLDYYLNSKVYKDEFIR